MKRLINQLVAIWVTGIIWLLMLFGKIPVDPSLIKLGELIRWHVQ